MTDRVNVFFELKTLYRDGTNHVFFNTLGFIGKLAAIIAPPRLNLPQFFCVFAPNSAPRVQLPA